MTWYVDDGGEADFTTIQAAVSNASSGDTICVLSGTYSRFSVSKPYLTIQAIETDGPVTIDSSSGDVCIPLGTHQDATGTTIDGFTFYCNGNDNGCDPIYLGVYGPANDSIIRNCTFEGLTLSVCVNAHNVTVENNIFANSGTPGRLICSLSTGQYVIPDVSINIVNNTFTNVSSKYGHIALMDTTGNCNIINNTFSNVSVTKYGLISPKNTSGTITIAGNTFDSTEGHTFYFRDAGEDNRIYLNNNVSSVALHAGSTAPVNISWNATAPVTYTYKDTEHTGFIGNFWSNYAASDADGDGILDTPHVLPSGLGTDHAPLAGAWENGVIASPAPEPKTWYVGEGGDYAAIQAAVDAAAAGDTIVVKDGAYTENVLVDRALTLMTENGPANVTVTAAVPTKPVFDLRADGITIRGFTTRGPTNEHVASIESVGYDDCLIIGNDCGGECYNGIHLGGNATNCTITENSCHGNTKRGISLRDDACGNFVYNNTCTGNADQICAKDNSHDNYIWANTFAGSVQCLGEDTCHSPEEVAYTYNGVGYTGYVGNYYSGYTGIDADGNGIGDTPVFIGHDKYTNTDRYDNYPMMGPWTGPWRNGTIVFVEPAPATPSDVTITSPAPGSTYATGVQVHLAATATGTGLTYTWDLGNGDNVTGQTADYTYATVGNYTITLTVANSAGSASASTSIVIQDSAPSYTILYQDTVTITNGSTIRAAISSRSGGYKPGEDSIEIPANSVGGMLNAGGFVFDMWKSKKPVPTYSLMDITTPEGVCYPNVQNATADLAWRSFDGMTSAATRYDPDVALANGTTIYTVYGDYNVVKSDPSGARYVIVTTLNIVEPGPAITPVAGFAASTTSGDAPLAVAFTDRSTNTPTSWSWAFGDGATSAEQNPVHTYTTAGTYTVTLTVANTAGSDSATKTITVTESSGGEASVLTLHSGWNFVSTPKRLADGANTFAIFNGVDTAGHTILLYDGLDYDWKMMSPTDTFRPLDAVWIYANTSYTIPLTFAAGAPELPPAKDLGKGWNAIGFTGTAPQSAAPTLLSLGDRWATLIGYDAKEQKYENAIIRSPESATQKMQPMQGYWIYMTQAETLAAISG
ncbi:MAG: PKD domain-containing protein [Methanoculleus sp.]|nr:PKD domain-containing protein [Methanoculleus sp.]